MILIGEKLNSSIPRTLRALTGKDSRYLAGLAQSQQQAGAHYIDLNTAMCSGAETEMMDFLLDAVLPVTQCGIVLDSPDVEVIRHTLPRLAGKEIILNSVTLTERRAELVPLAKEYQAGVIGLPIDDQGMPGDDKGRIENGKKLADTLLTMGLSSDQIYIDLLTETLSVNNQSALNCVHAAETLRREYPDIHLVCGLSNISFGLPKRLQINRAFLTLLIAAGADAAIMDVCDKELMLSLEAARAVAGLDEYCMDYIQTTRRMSEAD